MKNLSRSSSSLFIAACLSFVVFTSGCVTANPDKSPGAPAFVASPQIATNQATAQTALQSLTTLLLASPAAPVVPILPTVLAAFFAITTGISSLVASKKSQAATTAQAAADTHSAAAAALAAVVNSSQAAPGSPSASQVALQYAAQNGSVAAVAQHLANAANPVQL